MKKTIITLMAVVLIIGCGGGGNSDNDTPQPINENIEEISKIHKDPIVEKVENTNFQNLIEETRTLSKENYIAYYKRMTALKFISIPDLNVTFDLKKGEQNSTQAKNINSYEKVIYQSIWSRSDEYTCYGGGTVSKEVELFPRGHLDPALYKTGDATNYVYDKCNMGNVIYSGQVQYHVGTSNSGVTDIYSDSTFGFIPLGTFNSVFNYLSLETETQKVTLNGTIRFDATSARRPAPSNQLERLEKKYDTIGDFTITVYDKKTAETTKLIYNGTLEKVVYQETNKDGETDASVIDLGIIGKFSYRRTSNYTLRVEQDSEMFTLDINNNISGPIAENGQVKAPHPGGSYTYTNTSTLHVSDHSIDSMVLADGTTRYILDMNSDWFPEANEVEGNPQYSLPPSDTDLMEGIVVIGFDGCPHTLRIQKNLDELNIPHDYINIRNTQKERNILHWFSVSRVPYVGINGNFFDAGGYTKNLFTLFFNRQGYEMDKTLVEQARGHVPSSVKSISASVWLKEKFDELQGKEKHTAMAVANDTPYVMKLSWAYNEVSAQRAEENALKRCEEARKKLKSEGKKEIFSQCRLYSVDGEIKSQSIIRAIPKI